MENVELDDIAKPEATVNTSHRNHQKKSDTVYEAPLGTNNATHEEHLINDVADEYPSVIRRTVIVTGVALALFCVSYQSPS